MENDVSYYLAEENRILREEANYRARCDVHSIPVGGGLLRTDLVLKRVAYPYEPTDLTFEVYLNTEEETSRQKQMFTDGEIVAFFAGIHLGEFDI